MADLNARMLDSSSSSSSGGRGAGGAAGIGSAAGYTAAAGGVGATTAAGGGGPGGLFGLLSSFVSSLTSSCTARRIQVGGRSLRILRLLAEGGYSFVYLCQDESSGGYFAVKAVLCQNGEQREAALREKGQHLLYGRSSLVMPLVDFALLPSAEGDGNERAYFLFPYYRQGSLQDAISLKLQAMGGVAASSASAPSFFSESACLRYAGHMLQALASMHEKGYCHRDICPRNVMLNDRDEAVLIDLGSAVPARVCVQSRAEAVRLQEEAQAQSTMSYRAVELWDPPKGGFVTEKADIWSLGGTLYAMAFGYSPFESVRGEDGKLRIAEPSHTRALAAIAFPSPHCFSPAFCELILWLTQQDADKRPTAQEALLRVRSMRAGQGVGALSLQPVLHAGATRGAAGPGGAVGGAAAEGGDGGGGSSSNRGAGSGLRGTVARRSSGGGSLAAASSGGGEGGGGSSGYVAMPGSPAVGSSGAQMLRAGGSSNRGSITNPFSHQHHASGPGPQQGQGAAAGRLPDSGGGGGSGSQLFDASQFDPFGTSASPGGTLSSSGSGSGSGSGFVFDSSQAAAAAAGGGTASSGGSSSTSSLLGSSGGYGSGGEASRSSGSVSLLLDSATPLGREV